MKIILFRFEKEKINFMKCDLNSGNLTPSKREKISLMPASNSGEKYKQILDELFQIRTKNDADLYTYLPSQGYRGKIDEIRFANEAMLDLFCCQNKIDLLSLAPPSIRKTLAITNQEFKQQFESKKKTLSTSNSLAMSDIILDGLTYLSLVSGTL
jgi:hypothetical protein